MEPPVESAITPRLQKLFRGTTKRLILHILPLPITRSSVEVVAMTVATQMHGALRRLSVMVHVQPQLAIDKARARPLLHWTEAVQST